MKPRKRFNWFKFVTTSMCVVGIGFFLLTLVLSRLLWKGNDFTLSVPEDEPIRSQERNSKIVAYDNYDFPLAQASKEFEPFTKEVSANPPIETLEEDLKEVPEDLDFSSDSSSSQELPSNKSEQSNTSAIDAQVQAIETEIMELLLDYGDIIDQIEILANELYPDPDVVSKYIVARRETGEQIMHQSALYQILTGDRDVILPGGWIYELGKTVGLEIQHEE